MHRGPEGFPGRESGAGRFATTRWTVLRNAAGEGEAAAPALDRWCRAYWPPVYAHVLRQVRDPHRAEDLTQEFFLKWMSHDWLSRPEPVLGKFRTFLLTVLKRFLRDEEQKAHALKRGAGQEAVPFDSLEIAGPSGGFEDLFDREWAKFIMKRSLEALEDESDPGRFALLRPFLERQPEEGEYKRLAAHFKGNPNAVAAAVKRMRSRLKQLLREEVGRTVSDPEDAEEELRYLLHLMVS